jgi:hypothetical protein
MTRRWRALLRPDDSSPAPVPGAREVLCAWALGLAWTLGCLWLASASRPAALPILLLAGVLVVWGWAYTTWFAWFPGVLVIAAVVQPFVPFEFAVWPEPVGITGTLAIAILLIGTVRAVAFRRRLFPRTPIDGALIALLLLLALSAIPTAMRGAAMHELKHAFVGIATFYACTAVASIPGGSLRLWPVFPLALASVALTAALQAGGLITPQDSELGRMATLQSVLIALPPAIGLAMDAGRRGARIAWRVIVVAGLASAAAFAFHGFGPHDLDSPFRLGAPLGFGRAVVVWAMLFGLATLALRQRHVRPRERARWIGLAISFLGSIGLELVGHSIATLPQIIMLATGAGIATGTARVAAHRAQAAAPRVSASATANASATATGNEPAERLEDAA